MHDDQPLSDDEDVLVAPAPVAHYIEPTVELNPMEARVLGCLIEKSYLTPDVYPMTTNSLVTACNQKTSRDPVVSYSGTEIDAVLLELRQRKLVRRVHTQGARSTKHRHSFDEVLPLTEQQIVVLSVLLLRGDQTANELRTRTERHQVFHEPAALHECLESLQDRDTPLVEELARQSGHKENRWRHLLGDGSISTEPDASETLTRDDAPAPAAPPAPDAPGATAGGLQDRVAVLEADVAALKAQLRALATSLGEELS